MRKAHRLLVVVAVLSAATAACGDTTVTSGRATPAEHVDDVSQHATDAADDARLADVDRTLRDLQVDLSAVDQGISTPEGDPTQ